MFHFVFIYLILEKFKGCNIVHGPTEQIELI